jgi:carboxypeptidase Q
MSLRRIVFILTVCLLGLAGPVVALRAQQQHQQEQSQVLTEATIDADHKIITEIKDHNEIMSNLEYLSDMIGPRLTGTENLVKANHWTQERFAAYGLEDSHLESWQITHAWHRGTARGRIISPAEHPLTMASMGWAPSTPGAVRGQVVYVSAKTTEELQAYKGKLKGAIVITAEPRTIPPPYVEPSNPLLVPFREEYVLRPPAKPGQPVQPRPPYYLFLREAYKFFKEEGAAAVLLDSSKEDALLNMTGIGGRNYDIGALPIGFITSENYELIWRLMKRGPVRVEVEITNSFSDKPVDVYNTVAEIRGSEKPDEVVVIGAHLDSWDLGTGTTDNGTGSMVVLEAARALEKLGLKPKRTIRFVLFSGEEQGLNGSRAYVEAHKSDFAKFSAILVHDTGTGKVLSLGLQGNYQVREILDKALEPLREIGLLELSLRSMSGTDHLSFDQAGVPGFYAIQDPMDYNRTHHSQSDTFDRAHEDTLIQGAQVLAVWAYNIAQLPDLLPRKPSQQQKDETQR